MTNSDDMHTVTTDFLNEWRFSLLRFAVMFLLFICFHPAGTSAQIVFQNPSFEGTPAGAQAPPNWFICSGTPDIQPGFYGTTQTPSHGNTYLGFHHEESVSAYFPNGIGLCSGLQFTMDVSIVPLNVPGNSLWESNNQGVNPGYICIYGGYSSCDFTELLWQSELLTNVSNWQTINIQLTATQNFTYLNFAPCVNANGSWTYFGIDNIQGVVNAPVPVDVGPAQTVCIGQPINLSASFTGATSYSWTGPNGFTSNQQNPVISSATAAASGTYSVSASVGTCQSAPTNVNVTVNNCPSTVSGIINQYTPVTAFNPCNNSVSVGNATPFAVGDRALIIQMKGATIDLSNTAAFGNITDLGDAGNYEFVEIAAINGNDVQFTNTLLNSYTVSGLVQLITVPQYTDMTVTGTLTCQLWNGTVGGVLVFEASGTVTLNGDIDVKGKGFRLGNVSQTGYNCPGHFGYFYDISSYFGGAKGEGIVNAAAGQTHGMGKSANGGGGGNNVNAGGGGGGNSGQGGNGGYSWEGCPIMDIGGRGGLQLPYSNTDRKIFMGGGGGGGQQNQQQATPGTSGGGIVIVRANALNGNSRLIDASAPHAVNAGCDGAGGGGAGGSVLLCVSTVSGPLSVLANGGNGAITTCYQQGASGGGGGGAVWSVSPLSGAVTANVSGGVRGVHGIGSQNGQTGITLTGLTLNESTTPWSPIDTPSFTFNTPCPGETLTLSGVWASPDPVAFSWAGPGGYTATGQNASVPSATAANNGTYTLTVTDAIGCTASWDTVVAILPLPLVSAGADASVCPDGTLQLSATGAQTYQWSPAIGLDDASTAAPTFTAGTTTTFTVTGTDANGCIATDDVMVTVLTTPTSQQSINICEGDPYTLPDGTVVTDGGTYQSMLVSAQGCDSVITTTVAILPVYDIMVDAVICDGETHTLPSGNLVTLAGSYPETFQTVNGCDSTITTVLTVNPSPVITIPVSICLGQSYLAQGAAQNMAGLYSDTLATVLGCDSVIITQLFIEPIITHTLQETICPEDSVFTGGYWKSVPGTYNDTLVTPEGCDSLLITVLTNHPSPVADIAVTNTCLDEPLTINDASTVSSGNVAAWQWAFGNGATSNQQQPPSQTFPAAGVYDITLTVWSNNGCIDSTASTVVIHPLPTADFTADSVCLGGIVQLTDLSTFDAAYPLTQWGWVFGDGQTSAQQSPQVLFAQPGPQGALLTVTNMAGCKADTFITVAMVHPLPEAVIATPDDHCFTDTVLFSQTSAVQQQWGDVIVQHSWEMGDGTAYASPEASHVYSTQGMQTVTLTVLTNNGCNDAATAQVEVFALPQPAFSVLPAAGCEPLEVVFWDASTIAPPYAVNQWDWTLGEDISATEQSPVRTFAYNGADGITPDTLQVSLHVTSAQGCSSPDTAFSQVVVFPLPEAAFTVTPDKVDMVNPTVALTDLSSDNVTTHDWQLGDGQRTADIAFLYTYRDTGTYHITLLVTTEYGCTDTAMGKVTVSPAFTFYIPNTFTPNSNGRNDVFRGLGEGYTDHRLLVFNRWGEQIFEGEGDMGWDGTYKGMQVQSGVYSYIITLRTWEGEEKQFVGHVNLTR